MSSGLELPPLPPLQNGENDRDSGADIAPQGDDQSATSRPDEEAGQSKPVAPMGPHLPRIPRGPALREQASAASAGSDTRAQKEQDQLGSKRTPEQLAADAAELEHDRTQHFRDAFEKVAIGALMIGAVTILVLAVIWALHLVLPANKRWLTPEDLTHIQTLLTAGVLVGVVSSHFKKRLGDLK